MYIYLAFVKETMYELVGIKCVCTHWKAPTHTYILDSVITVLIPRLKSSEHFPAYREGLDERNADAVALL